MNPILLEIPSKLETERLILRMALSGDGRVVNEAIKVYMANMSNSLILCRSSEIRGRNLKCLFFFLVYIIYIIGSK